MMATTNYLKTPLPLYDMYVGKYTNNSYFAIKGSNWDNIAVSTNATQIESYALGNITSGTIWLKDVHHSMALAPSVNVTVIEEFNGVERRFGNPANSQGSPYAVSVDNVNAGYYLAEDRLGTIRWSSTFLDTVVSDALIASAALTNGGVVVLQSLQFNTSLTVPAKVTVIQQYQGTTRYFTASPDYLSSPLLTTQLSFERYQYNPVLDVNSSASVFDTLYASDPSVVVVNGTYVTFYSGYNGTFETIGYATSSNLVTWTKYAGTPVIDYPTSQSWDANRIYRPCLLYVNKVLLSLREILFPVKCRGMTCVLNQSYPFVFSFNF